MGSETPVKMPPLVCGRYARATLTPTVLTSLSVTPLFVREAASVIGHHN